jgi:uncharacterized protein (TIGR03435 family)
MTQQTSGTVIYIILMSFAGLGQAPGHPSFEVASVKAAQRSAPRGSRVSVQGDRVSYNNTTLKNVLARAYQVKWYQVTGPAWISTERYDILAKAPDNTPKDQIPLMLQGLLAERFKLTLHREMKEMPVYALMTGKAVLQLQKAEHGGEEPASFEMKDSHREAKNMSLAQLADMLSLMLARPVLDVTGVSGYYDFAFDYSMEEMGGMAATDAGAGATNSAPSVFTILHGLGLKLESRKAPIEVIVIDGGNQMPVEN